MIHMGNENTHKHAVYLLFHCSMSCFNWHVDLSQTLLYIWVLVMFIIINARFTLYDFQPNFAFVLECSPMANLVPLYPKTVDGGKKRMKTIKDLAVRTTYFL